MINVNLGDMLKQAEEDGDIRTNEEWADGQYKLVINKANAGDTKNGKPKLGIMWKHLEGPLAGSSKWENVNVDPTSSQSVAIFVNKLLSLGISKEMMEENPPLEQVAEMLQGTVALVDVRTAPWKSDPSRSSMNTKVVKIIDADTHADEDDTTEDNAAEETGGLFGGFNK